jgi:cell division protease FtsH
MLVEESEPLHKITIIPRGRALGSTMQLPEKDRYLDGRRKLMSMLTLFMGGRVAEELVIGDITSGAASDLKEATRIARLMVCSWGMSDLLGPQTFGANEELLFFGREVSRSQDYSEETARKIDSEVNRLLSESHEKAKQLIMQHRDALETLALALLERETLDGEEARAMLAASLKPAVGAEG